MTESIVVLRSDRVILRKGGYIRELGSVDAAHRTFGLNSGWSGLLFPAIRWMGNDNMSFLIEQPPHIQRIYFNEHNKDNILDEYGSKNVDFDYSYDLPMPWLSYAIRFTDVNLSCIQNMTIMARNEPIYSEEDVVHPLPLPNFSSSFIPCLGEASEIYQATFSTLPQRDMTTLLALAIQSFWSCGFNEDICIHSTSVPPKWLEKFPQIHYENESSFLQNWEDMSIDNILETKFAEINASIGSILIDFDSQYENPYNDVLELLKGTCGL